MGNFVLTGVRLLGSGSPVDLPVTAGRVAAAPAADAEPVPCDGRWVMPGLWDQHAHLTQWAIGSRRLDVSAATSAAQAAALCRDAATGRDDPLVAASGHLALWPDEPDPALLDAARGGRPTVVVAFDLHSAWANQAALQHYGLGHLAAGVVREEDAFELQRRMTDLPDPVADAWVAEAAAAAAARGVVGVVDMEMTWNTDPWRRRMAAGLDTLRVRASVYPQWLDRALDEGLCTGDVDPEHPLLSVGPLKVISDGSLNTRTACCHDLYPGTQSRGVLNFEVADLHDMMRRATAGGLECAFHAIGDLANATVLDAFAATGARGQVEHAQLLSDVDLPRFAQLGVRASVQPQHALDDREAGERLWPGRTQRMYRFRDLIDAGAELLLGSDAPVAPLDPWFAVQAAVERCLPGEQPWHPEQRITAAEALAASTDGRGLVPAPGAPADLVLLDADPLEASGDLLRHLPVAATLVAGRLTHGSL